MYLQLAESRSTNVKGYYRKKHYVPGHKRRLNEGAEEVIKNPYIYIPQFMTATPSNPAGLPSGVNVREDYFDDLDNAEYNELMSILAPYQKGLSEAVFLSSRAERRAKREERREKRQQNKEERKKNRAEAFGKIVDTIGSVASRVFGGGEVTTAPTTEIPQEVKPWYKNPLVIIGGIALVGGGIYLATKKK